MIKTVIFDLDGLLIDSEGISFQLYQDLLRPYGYSITIEEYAQNYSGKTEIGNMEAIIKGFQLPISMEEGLEFIAAKEKACFIQGVSLKAGVKEVLEYLKEKKYRIVLASSSAKERALSVLAQHKIKHYFQQMVFGTEVEKGKPYPDIFLKACEKTNESQKSCLVLEDSEAGIQAAFSAGIPVICIPDIKKPEEKFLQMTEAIFDSLLELIPYLEQEAI